MIDAALHDTRILLTNDILETTAATIGYLEGLHHYHGMKNTALMKYNLRCAIACLRAAARSWNEMEALDQPEAQISEAAK